MFHKADHELHRLQQQLDQEREILERARKAEELSQAACSAPPVQFRMADLYTTVYDGDCAPISMAAYRR